MIKVQSPVKITERAISEIRHILEKKKIPENYGLRIGVKNAGSPSESHILGFDTKTELDNEYNAEGIPVYIQKSDIIHLAGFTVDYYPGPDTTGFTFLKSS